MYTRPLIVQNDGNIYLLEWLDSNGDIEHEIGRFSDLIKAPEEVHTYYLSAHALWSAAAKGIKADSVIDVLTQYADNELSSELIFYIKTTITDFGSLRLNRDGDKIELVGVVPAKLTPPAK